MGSLTPGRPADLIVCPDDVFTCAAEHVKDIIPLLTMVGGEVDHRRDAWWGTGRSEGAST